MSTDDNDNNDDKIDHTINFDPNGRAIKPIEEHPLFHLAKEKGPSCDRQEDALTGIYKTAMDDESFFKKTYRPVEQFWAPGSGKEVWDSFSDVEGQERYHIADNSIYQTILFVYASRPPISFPMS
jgi:hypothetical protein